MVDCVRPTLLQWARYALSISLTVTAGRRSLGRSSQRQLGDDGEPACRRDSVHPLAGFGGHPSERSTWGWCPGGVPDGPPVPPFDLAPGGVYRADRVTPAAGALLPHRFTLTCAHPGARHRRSVLCGTFLQVAPTGR
jgi:hypothetical protein